MNKEILLTVIIPAYNAECFIREILDCVFPQLNHEIELILIDDGSSDNTYKLINDYISCYFERNSDSLACMNNIKLLHQSNGGCSKARNRGLRECSGKYVTFIDSDDKIKSDYLDTFLKCIEQHDEFDVYITGVETYSEDGSLYEVVQNRIASFETHDSSVEAIVLEDAKLAFPMWGKLIRMDYLRHNGILFDDDAVHMSDAIFYSKVYQHIQKLVLSDYVGYEWRRRKGAIGKREYDDSSIVLTARYLDNCKKIIKSVKDLQNGEIARDWMLNKKKNGFDNIVNAIECSSKSKERKASVKKVIKEILDYDVINTFYVGSEKRLLFLAKKNNSYFWYKMFVNRKRCIILCERVTNAIKRRIG